LHALVAISDIFAGISDVKVSSIELLLDAMGKSYTQFGKCIDGLTEKEILKYKRDKEKERIERRGSKE
jgi:hypothetical protein